MLLFGGAVSLSWIWGIVLVLVAEHLDTGFTDARLVRQWLPVPLLAIAPQVRTNRRSRHQVSRYVTEKPFSLAAEAARSIVTSMTLAGSGSPSLSLLVCSAVAKEGKTTIATWIARAAAQSAQRVIVIDGDTRNPSLHRSFGGVNQAGFSELLSRRHALSELIQHDQESGVDYISSGRQPVPSYGHASLNEVEEALDALKRQYDLVVIDSPPLMAMADGLLFSSIADMTLFVCRSRRTSRGIAARALERIQQSGGNVIGVILSIVKTSRTSPYGDEFGRANGRDIRKYYLN
jgi:capsular exopolysaccharide synthesis family protein